MVAAAAGAVLLPIPGQSSVAMPVGSPEVARATTVQVASAALSPSAITQGAPVTLIAAVTPSTAAGTVQFRDGTTNFGSPVPVTKGIASSTTSTSALAVGSHALTAVFLPTDRVYSSSTSPGLSLTVAAPSQGGSLDASASQAQPSGQSLDEVTSASLPDGPLGIPGVMLDAYQRAERVMAQIEPGCHLSWATLAGIGKIESGHASGGRVDTAGNTLGPILGPQLDGSLDTVAISDTDRGTLDADAGWDRAVGPMQFIPASWRVYGTGNPNNIYDSTLAAGRYLCAGGADLSDPTQEAVAIYRYNHSVTYVSTVLRWTQGYLTGVVPTPSEAGPVPQVTDGDEALRVRTVAQRTPQVGVANLDSPAVANLDSSAPAQLDAQPSAPAAATSPSPVSLDSPH
ncbi:MAG: Ig-like domain repeat protein [Pseudonocardiaceae bacterium]